MESRLERELKKWEEREQRFREGKVFSAEVLDGPLLKEKLAHFDRLSILYKPVVGSDQLDYHLLQAERKKIRRMLYPGLFRRLLSGILSMVKLNRQANKLKVQATFSNEELKSSLIRAGFSEQVGIVMENMKLGRDFTLPVSYYVNEGQRMDYQLNFNRGAHGEFKFESYKAILKTESNGEQVAQTFPISVNTGFTADQAFHLLSGRSVCNKVSGGAWQQLDFNDRDAEGNYRFKIFPNHYHNVDYFKMLSELPHVPGVEIDLNRIIHKLANGEQALVTLMKDGKANDYKIQVNPQNREIGIYEASGNKVNLNAKGESEAEIQKSVNKQESPNRRRAQKMN